MHAIRGWPDTGHSTTFNMGECGNIHTFPKIFMYYTKSLAWFYGSHPNTATASDQARRAELSRMRMRLLCMNNSVRLIAIITELLVAIKAHKKSVHSKMVSQQQMSQFSRSSYSGTHLCLHKSGWDWSVSQCVLFCLSLHYKLFQ